MNLELLENPAELLREVRDNFIIQQDVDSLHNIDTKIEDIRNKSQENTKATNIQVTKLKVQLESSQSKSEELERDVERIKRETQELGGTGLVVDNVNALDELEKEIVSLRSQLDARIAAFVREERSFAPKETSLGEDLNESIVSISDFDEREAADIMTDPIARANILKIKLYRSMKVVLDEDNNQALIEAVDNKIDTLPLDGGLSDFFKTKYIWERIESSR